MYFCLSLRCFLLSLAHTGDILKGLSVVLGNVARNPVSPNFNHYLFEALAAIIKQVCSSKPELVPQFEEALLPAFQFILQVRFIL